MKLKKNILLILSFSFLLPITGNDFVLVRDHKAECSIVLPKASRDKAADAARRFNQTLKTITGTSLPVVKQAASGNRIVFKLRKTDSLKTTDNFTITFPDSRTMQIEGTEVSVQWAFNHIIREFAKADWVLPESCGLSYTPMKDLSVPAEKIEVKDISWSVSRYYPIHTIWWRQNIHRRLEVDHDLTKHAFPVKKYGKDNSWPKAILPVLNGKKITRLPDPKHYRLYWQPCYSNPETAKIAVENLLEYLKVHPGTLGLSMGCNDNRGFCECAACMKMDKNRRNNRSESYFTFINRVLNEVCKKYPDLIVSLFAYDLTYQPPSFKLHPNAIVYLTIDFNSCADPKLLAKHKKIIAEWGSKASMLGLYDYAWGYPYPAPRLFEPYHLGMLKYMYDHNARAYFGFSWMVDAGEGPKPYLITKLLWNSKQDMKKLKEEWYIRCVGKKAAPYLKAYYKVWNDYYTGRARQTPWFNSAPAAYMAYYDNSNVNALSESDIQAADKAMKQVVALAGAAQEKQRAELLMRHWRYTLLRLRMLGAGIYDADGLIRTQAQALRLLETVRKFPEYRKEYQQIGDELLKEKELKEFYLNKYYSTKRGTPLALLKMYSANVHLLAASKFANDPAVGKAMEKLAGNPAVPASIRQFCKMLQNPEGQPNLLPDGNAENGVKPGYEIHPELRWGGVLSTSDVVKADGNKSFLVSIKGHDTLFWIQTKAKPNTMYLATFKAWTEKPSAEGYLEITFYCAKNGLNQQWRNPPPQKLSGGNWQTFSVLTSTQANSNGLQLRIYMKKFDKGDKIYIDDIRLIEVGPAARDKPKAKVKPAAKNAAGTAKTIFRIEKPSDLTGPKPAALENGIMQITGSWKYLRSKSFVLDPKKITAFSASFGINPVHRPGPDRLCSVG